MNNIKSGVSSNQIKLLSSIVLLLDQTVFSIVLMYALLDGGWFVVGILIGGLFSNKWYLALQDSHEYGVMENRFSRTGTLLRPECCLSGCRLILFPGYHQRSHIQDLCPLPVINNLLNHYHVSCWSWMWSNKYYYTTYPRIKVRSILGVRVFFHHICAKAVLIPAEEEKPDEEEQHWVRRCCCPRCS